MIGGGRVSRASRDGGRTSVRSSRFNFTFDLQSRSSSGDEPTTPSGIPTSSGSRRCCTFVRSAPQISRNREASDLDAPATIAPPRSKTGRSAGSLTRNLDFAPALVRIAPGAILVHLWVSTALCTQRPLDLLSEPEHIPHVDHRCTPSESSLHPRMGLLVLGIQYSSKE